VKRAALLVQRRAEYEEQNWSLLLSYALEHRYLVVSIVRRDPAAAVRLVRAHIIDVIVAGVPDDQGLLLDLGAACEFIRPLGVRAARRMERAATSTMVLISDMLRRGGTPETIAQLLAVDLADVLAVAAGPDPAAHVRDSGRFAYTSPVDRSVPRQRGEDPSLRRTHPIPRPGHQDIEADLSDSATARPNRADAFAIPDQRARRRARNQQLI